MMNRYEQHIPTRPNVGTSRGSFGSFSLDAVRPESCSAKSQTDLANKHMETLVHVSATSHKSSAVHVKALHVELIDYRVKGASDHISTRKRHVIRDPKTQKTDQNGSFAVLFSASALSSFELQSSNYWNY
jgi:hypothetical protein